MSNKKTIIFKDYLTFKIDEQSNLSLKDSVGLTSTGRKVIFPRIAATHSGRITGNYGFYLPDKMQKAITTFTSPYPKPILVHHNDHADPIGRIINSRYVDTSGRIKDSWDIKKLTDSKRPISDSLLDAFCLGKLSQRETIDIVDRYFLKDYSFVEDPSYEGLGFAEIVAAISDQEAVEKILDKRYLTGSIGASTASAVCSICRKDWGKEDRCDHQPGKLYDERRCILIAGDLTFHEYSFVNDPADSFSRVIEILNGENRDTVAVHDSTKERIPEISLLLEDSKRYINDIIVLSDNRDLQLEKTLYNNNQSTKGLKEDLVNMLFKHALELARKDERLASLAGLEDAVKELVDSKISEDQLIDSLLTKFSLKDESQPESKVEIKDYTQIAKDIFGIEDYTEVIGDDPWGKEYAEMMMMLLDDVEEDKREATIKLIKDAKLSSAARKKLSSSTFCGPDRSFPIPDCAHVTAGHRMLSRYKGPGDKEQIKACIDRKSKRMGCSMMKKEDSKSSDGQINDSITTIESFDNHSDEQLIQLADTVLLAIKERELECSACKEAKEQSSKLQDQVKSLNEQIEALKKDVVDGATVKDKQRELDAMKRELKYVYSDVDLLQDELLKAQDQLKSTKIDRVLDYSKLENSQDLDLAKLTDELSKKSLIEIEDLLKSKSSSVDLQKITDKMKSGIVQEPIKTVEDPTLKQDNNNDSKEIDLVDANTVSRIRHQCQSLKRKVNGQLLAERLIADYKEKGIIPASYPIETFLK